MTRLCTIPSLALLTLVAPAVLAQEGHASCDAYKIEAVKKACRSAANPDQRQDAIKSQVMKPATQEGKDLGLVTTCKSCHTDLKTYATTKDAGTLLSKILSEPAKVEPAVAPESTAATEAWVRGVPAAVLAPVGVRAQGGAVPRSRGLGIGWLLALFAWIAG